ncbi:hypothetical protein [Motiliproteus sp. MSK22-1]|uniref:hypothetical protein n=1 Tax=Motiliproteus sp. MSK22-1 TaxID=1897630 RepID=UPI0009784DAF|nr:hypothetical protein [Motiliproteus sp. MSK22-1]OMH33668.1 hypothetical protein BGP75_11690 [Motiliproteus sp. MSK22-1]
MTFCKTFFLLLFSGAFLMQSNGVLAHYPLMVCSAVGVLINCEVGFSDGSKAIGKPVRIFDYQENLIQTRKADRFSRVQFERPEGEFYLQFDSGHEFPVEVDVGEL